MAHWTEEYFVDNPELFLMYFEMLMERVPGEVDYLLNRLADNVFKPKRILDMNCGIGRHSVELGHRGIEVLGTDISPLYVKIAGERAIEAKVDNKVSFRVADMREIGTTLAGISLFDGIICLQTAMGFYEDATEENIVRQCCSLVKPGGFFALDIINRDCLLPHYSETTHRAIKNYRVLEQNKYDVWKSRNVSTWTYLRKKDEGNYEEVKSITLDLRLWSPHELISMFEKAGFTIKGIYSGLMDFPAPHELTSINTREFTRNIRLLYLFGKPLQS